MPIRRDPVPAIFWEILGTHNLLPNFAAIWSRIFVKIDWKPFFWRLVEMVTWLLISNPFFSVIRLTILYCVLKLGGMMNQKMLEFLL